MTGAKLLAGRFSVSDTESELLEQFSNVSDVGLDWSTSDFGLTRIEVTIKAKNEYDAFDRYQNHQGQRLAVYTSDLYFCVSGKIYAIELLPGDLVKYTAYGALWDMERAYITKSFASTDTIGDTVEYIAGKIPVVSSNYDNIEANTTTLDGWNPDTPTGSYPSDALKDLINMGDSSYRVYDVRLIDQPLKATTLRQYDLHYTYRDTAASADWVVKRKDIKLNMSRNIESFANIVRVWYGLIEGTSTSVTSTTMTDTSATFISDGVSPGDQITNATQGGYTRVVSVDSETQITHEGWRSKYTGIATGGTLLTLDDTEADFINDGVVIGDTLTNIVDNQPLATRGIGTITAVAATSLTLAGGMSGGSQNDAGERYQITGAMTAGDDYSIRTDAQTKFREHQIDKGNLWDKEIAIFERNMNETQAAQYAQVLATVSAEQVQSFVFSAPYIEDGNGAKHHPVDVILSGGGYMQISDLYPTAAQFSDALNSLTTFFITALSYDNKTNKLTVDVDTPARRLDSRLVRAGILRTPQVQRY